MTNNVIMVKDIPININMNNGEDYICITDIAKAKNVKSRIDDIIKNWLRNRSTLEFLGTWEQIYNLDFKPVEFDWFKKMLDYILLQLALVNG